MPDHKFEPFQWVLVRGVTGVWLPDLYGCEDVGATKIKHLCTGGISYEEIVPYTDETAHLIGTTQPYEPPKPPQEYEWGQKVEVLLSSGQWNEGIYLEHDDDEDTEIPHRVATRGGIAWFKKCNIRPLTDSAAN